MMKLSRCLLRSATVLALAACASVNPSRLLPPELQPILVLNGEIHSCQNQRRSALDACEAAKRIPSDQVLSSLVLPPKSAQAYYGSRGKSGAHLVVTNALRTASLLTGGATTVYVVGGTRYNCPPTQRITVIVNGCVPNLPPIASEQVESVEVIRSPVSLHFFGQYAVGGAIVIAMKAR